MDNRSTYKNQNRSGDGRHNSSANGQQNIQDKLVRGLGWFSIGLGVSELLAPGKVARLIGVRPRSTSRKLLRAYGVREIAAGVGILSNPQPASWMWSRVAGDMVDLASLGSAMTKSNANKTKLVTATTAVLGVTALDIICSQRLSQGNGSGASQKASNKRSGQIEETRSIIIDRSPEELYRFWHDFQNAPRFMPAVESVEITGDRRSHWRAKLPGGIPMQWDSEVIEDQPNSFIAWRAIPEALFKMNGNVRFDRAPGGRGTIVRAEIQLTIPAGTLAVKAAKPLGADPGEQLADSLRKFKQIMETGEIMHSDASIYPGKHAAQPPSEPARELVAH